MFKPVVVVLSSSDSEDDVIAISSHPPPQSSIRTPSAAVARPIASQKQALTAPDRGSRAQVQTRAPPYSLGGPSKKSWIWVSGASDPLPFCSKPNICPGDDCELLSDDDGATTVIFPTRPLSLQVIANTGTRSSGASLCSLDRPYFPPLC